MAGVPSVHPTPTGPLPSAPEYVIERDGASRPPEGTAIGTPNCTWPWNASREAASASPGTDAGPEGSVTDVGARGVGASARAVVDDERQIASVAMMGLRM